MLLTGFLAISSATPKLSARDVFRDLPKKRMSLNFPNDVFLLDLSFEAAQGIFKRFTPVPPVLAT